MTGDELAREERILSMVKKVLTNVARDTFAKPGFKHPLSEETILGIRDCLSLIVAREHELAEASGKPMTGRPRYIDEPRGAVTVPLEQVGGMKARNSQEGENES